MSLTGLDRPPGQIKVVRRVRLSEWTGTTCASILLVAVQLSVSLLIYGVLPRPRTTSTLVGRRRSSVPLEGTHAAIKLLKLLLPAVIHLTAIGDAVQCVPLRVWVAQSLQRAGLKHVLTVNQVVVSCALLGIATPLVAIVVAGVRHPLGLAVASVAGAALPGLLLRDLWRQRERQIVRLLPGTVDVLSLSVEAGLEFLVAVRRVVERGEPGPLRDELATVLQDVRLGQTRAQALGGLAKRVQAREVGEFCAVLVQADLLGASIRRRCEPSHRGSAPSVSSERRRLERRPPRRCGCR